MTYTLQFKQLFRKKKIFSPLSLYKQPSCQQHLVLTSRVVLCDLDNFKLRPLLHVTPTSSYAPLLQSADRCYWARQQICRTSWRQNVDWQSSQPINTDLEAEHKVTRKDRRARKRNNIHKTHVERNIRHVRLEAALRRIVSVWHQSTARAIRKQSDPMHSNRSHGNLMSYTDHSAQRRFKSNAPIHTHTHTHTHVRVCCIHELSWIIDLAFHLHLEENFITFYLHYIFAALAS